MSKQLCDLKKSLKGDIGSYMQLVSSPTHVCGKCGRAANSKKSLCKPFEIISLDSGRRKSKKKS